MVQTFLHSSMEMKNEILNDLNEQTVRKLHESVHDYQSLRQWKKEILHLIDEIYQVKLPDAMMVDQDNSSLDPTDWASARSTAHRMLDSSLDYIEYVRDRLVCRAIPDDIIRAIEDEPLPEKGQSLASVCDDVLNYVIPYARGNIHPGYWGWVSGEGTLGGMIADMIGSTLNINACAINSSSAFVERLIIEWMRQIFSFPKDTTGGLLVSGTSIATIISMATARQRAIGNVREEGLVNGPRLIAYASTETHVCVKKALEVIGLGSKAFHLIPVDENFQIKIDELKIAITNDRNNGLIPFCIIGNAGTVNTGAFDNLLELAAIARTENIWLHVDGAFGSFVILDPQRRHLVSGINQADSLAFDFHKWLHCPYDVGCVLVRDYTYLQSTFVATSPYLSKIERKNAEEKQWFLNMGPELSRSFRALKVWFTLKEHGTIKLGQKIADNCEQAQYLVSLLEKHPQIIRIIRPVSLNIVNFRFEPKELDATDDELIDLFNDELLKNIHSLGIALPSSTRIQNRIYIRVCIVSHRTTRQDFDTVMEGILNLYQIQIQKFIIQRKLN